MIRKPLFVALIIYCDYSIYASQSNGEFLTKAQVKNFNSEHKMLSNANTSFQLAEATPQLHSLTPSLRPSSNFDLSSWDLVTPLPLKGKGNAIRIESQQLVANPLKNSGYVKSPYFYTDPTTGSMNLFAPLNGATTPNTEYARSELSEDTSLQWNLAKYKDNSLTATMVIKKMPSNGGRITIGQIHFRGITDPYGNKVSKLPLLKIMYDTRPTLYGKKCGGCLSVEIRKTPKTGVHEQINTILATGVTLNTLFTYELHFKNDGALTAEITVKNKTYQFSTKLSTSKDNTKGWGSQYFLFHAGCYLNVKGTSSTDGAQVNIYYLDAKHI